MTNRVKLVSLSGLGNLRFHDQQSTGDSPTESAKFPIFRKVSVCYWVDGWLSVWCGVPAAVAKYHLMQPECGDRGECFLCKH